MITYLQDHFTSDCKFVQVVHVRSFTSSLTVITDCFKMYWLSEFFASFAHIIFISENFHAFVGCSCSVSSSSRLLRKEYKCLGVMITVLGVWVLYVTP